MEEDKIFLLCSDGSENSNRAARYLSEMASCLQGRVTLLHVLGNEEAVAMGDGLKSDDLPPSLEKRLTPAMDALDSQDIDYSVSVQIGDPESVILEMSSRYEAIVMGYKGVNERRIAELLMGSVADHVLRHTKKPVILVP